MVFFSSCAAVKYHAELLNYIDIPVKDIHGKQKQQRRTTTFHDFCKAEAVRRAVPPVHHVHASPHWPRLLRSRRSATFGQARQDSRPLLSDPNGDMGPTASLPGQR